MFLMLWFGLFTLDQSHCLVITCETEGEFDLTSKSLDALFCAHLHLHLT